jgi:hypothetical protein
MFRGTEKFQVLQRVIASVMILMVDAHALWYRPMTVLPNVLVHVPSGMLDGIGLVVPTGFVVVPDAVELLDRILLPGHSDSPRLNSISVYCKSSANTIPRSV